jgi:hypothetical protein
MVRANLTAMSDHASRPSSPSQPARRQVLALGTLGLLPGWAGAQAASAVDAGGVRFEPTLQVGGSTLRLNGAGVRYKGGLFKVYAAGLYLTAPASTPEAVLEMPGAKRIHLVLLRSIDASEFGKLLTSGIEKNATRDEFTRAIPALLRMGEVSASYRSLAVGDTLTLDWVPAVGTTLSVKGKPEVGPYKDPTFFNAMTKIWLGKAPADLFLKDALLGLGGKG